MGKTKLGRAAEITDRKEVCALEMVTLEHSTFVTVFDRKGQGQGIEVDTHELVKTLLHLFPELERRSKER